MSINELKRIRTRAPGPCRSQRPSISAMNYVAIVLLGLFCTNRIIGQQQIAASRASSVPSGVSDGPNLSVQKLGPDDLIGVSVYDAPELTHSVRIDGNGDIHLPMVLKPIHAAGFFPTELEAAIRLALIQDQVLVDPIVNVAVLEFHSRPITVIGAVKNPLTFQAAGTVTLLDAITRAGGVTESAGSEILISRSASSAEGISKTLPERIPIHALMSDASSSSNLKLEGGEVIRIPAAGQVFVVGNVKHPGSFPITNDSESSVLKMLALSGGLDNFTSRTAFIYRVDGTNGRKNEIPIKIKEILARKSPDMPLFGDDILYIPTANGAKTSSKALLVAATVGVAVGTMLVYVYH